MQEDLPNSACEMGEKKYQWQKNKYVEGVLLRVSALLIETKYKIKKIPLVLSNVFMFILLFICRLSSTLSLSLYIYIYIYIPGCFSKTLLMFLQQCNLVYEYRAPTKTSCMCIRILHSIPCFMLHL